MITHGRSAAPPRRSLPIADSATLVTDPSMKARLEASIVAAIVQFGWRTRCGLAASAPPSSQGVGIAVLTSADHRVSITPPSTRIAAPVVADACGETR